MRFKRNFRLGTRFYDRGLLVKWRGKWHVLFGSWAGKDKVVVHYIDTAMDSHTVGPFSDDTVADHWIARRQAEGVKGSWHIDSLIDPATWDSKS